MLKVLMNYMIAHIGSFKREKKSNNKMKTLEIKHNNREKKSIDDTVNKSISILEDRSIGIAQNKKQIGKKKKNSAKHLIAVE